MTDFGVFLQAVQFLPGYQKQRGSTSRSPFRFYFTERNSVLGSPRKTNPFFARSYIPWAWNVSWRTKNSTGRKLSARSSRFFIRRGNTVLAASIGTHRASSRIIRGETSKTVENAKLTVDLKKLSRRRRYDRWLSIFSWQLREATKLPERQMQTTDGAGWRRDNIFITLQGWASSSNEATHHDCT